MSVSIPVVIGAPTREEEYNELRFDAIVKTRPAVAGEAFTAMTTDASGIVFPTVVVQIGTQWFKANSDGVNIAKGYVQTVGLAYTASSGVGASFKVILPGSQITTEFFPTMSGGTAGLNIFPSATTSGGASAFSSTATVAWKLLGTFENSTTFNFDPTENSSLLAASGNLGVYLTSGSALTRGNIVTMNTSAKMVKVDSNDIATIYLFNPTSLFVVQHDVSAADKTVRCVGVGGRTMVIKEGGGSFTIGSPVYVSTTAGEGTQTEYNGLYTLMLGVAVSTTEVVVMPGYAQQGPKMRIQSVIAGENWSFPAALYMKKSDQRAYQCDSDVAEAGIAEFPMISLGVHSGGAGSTQLVIMPYSTIRCPIGFGAGDRLLPDPTPGAFRGNTPASLDTFWRIFGVLETTNSIRFEPQQMEFLPTGMQEKGYCAAGSRNDTTDADTAADRSDNGVNFKKIMVNIPSSITFTSVATLGSPTPTANDITRFGFRMRVENGSSGIFYWTGYYTTVGN
jgi:hypothetical protein